MTLQYQARKVDIFNLEFLLNLMSFGIYLQMPVSGWQICKERNKKSNIPSLKVGYNRVFGYYIEVTKTHAEKVPEHYIRKQTLTNSELYFTEELKEYEVKILSAEEKIVALELDIFESLQNEMLNCASKIQKNAKVLAKHFLEIKIFFEIS